MSPILIQSVKRLPAVTTTILTTSGSPANLGQSVIFKATVTSIFGTPTDGGVVSFKQGTTVLGTRTLKSGIASFTTSSLTVGIHHLRAAYPGDAT
jgi:large repetitive protein